MRPTSHQENVRRKALGEVRERRSSYENQRHLRVHFSICLEQYLRSFIAHHITYEKQEVSLRQLCKQRICIITRYIWDEVRYYPIGYPLFVQSSSLYDSLAHRQEHINSLSFYFSPEAIC